MYAPGMEWPWNSNEATPPPSTHYFSSSTTPGQSMPNLCLSTSLLMESSERGVGNV